jgi:predicted O-methyltransferase YrrM
MKLYEMAFFSDGDVLELGTYHALSTSFIAQALLNAGHGHRCDSIELDPRISAQAFRHLDRAGLNCVVELHVGDGAEVCRRLGALDRSYGFAFVDHSHSYEDVFTANGVLKGLVKPGGYALFHDYTDPRNSLRTGLGDHPDEFGVRNACDTAFADGSFRFVSTCGACGLYQRMG